MTAPQPHRWDELYQELSSSDRTSPLEPDGLEQLALAAYLTGRDEESTDVLARAHSAWIARGEAARAARAAFRVGLILISAGEPARASGWFARAQRVIDDHHLETAERGYLLLPTALQQVSRGDIAASAATFAEAASIGEQYHEPDLVTLARHGHGRTLIALGRVAEGTALLDEVMVAVTSGEVTPLIAGIVYCGVISACVDMFDIQRAQEWTEALNRWCTAQSGVVPFRGECLVHRAEIFRLHGVWPGALEEARRACEWLSRTSGHPAAGAAFYQLAEVHRLHGDLDDAQQAYERAANAGRTPHPGLALLRLAQGRPEAAQAAIARAMDEARDLRMRSKMLPAFVEIQLAAGDTGAARLAADELSGIAGTVATPLLRALSAHASGAVLLAEHDARRALQPLREACALWREIDAPYESARTTVLIALACRALGDADGAVMELNAAARAFRQLGASPDLARVESLAAPARPTSELTDREQEVLKLIASGKSNRAIADALAISEKTVARHVSNIFNKLDVSSRSAATAYAFKHHIV